jgi:hypothetical protein
VESKQTPAPANQSSHVESVEERVKQISVVLLATNATSGHTRSVITTPEYIQLGESEDPWFCPNCKSRNNSALIYDTRADTSSTSLTAPDPPVATPKQASREPTPTQNPSQHSSIFSTSVESSIASTSGSSIHSEVASLPSPSGNLTFNSPKTTSSPQQRTPKASAHPRQTKQKSYLRILNINFQSI